MLDLVDDLYQQGLKLHGSGKVELAYQVYTLVLNAHPEHSMANHSLGVLSVDIGKVQEALPFFEAALEANADVAQFWVSYIDALINLERIADAQAVFGQAKSNGAKGEGFDKLERRLTDARGEPLTANSTGLEEKQPKHSNILDGLKLDQALSLARKKARGGDTGEAKRIYQDILAKFPKNKRAINGLKGLADTPVENASKVQDPPQSQLQALINLYNQGQLKQALDQANILLQKFPSSSVLYNICGAVYKELGQFDASIEAFSRALTIQPDYADAYNNKGLVLKKRGKLEEAIKAYNKALAIKPDNTEVYNNMGNALQEQGKLEEAIEAYNKALALKPEYASAYYNMGITLQEQGKPEEAIEAYNKVLAIKPEYADAYNNMGIALKDLGKLEEAIEAYNKALALKPDEVEAHKNLSFTLLNSGKLKEGLEEYEWRWKTTKNVAKKRHFSKPMWDGKENLKGKKVLLWCEQGMGDTINWSSKLPLIVSQADHCILECQDKLVPLLAQSFPNVEIKAEDRAQDASRNDFDFHLPMGSLYKHFISEISENTKPDAFLVPDPDRIKFWRKRLESLGNGPFIGVSWKSANMSPKRLPNYAPISDWSPIFAIPSVTFINLQYTDFLADLTEIKNEFGVIVHNFDDLDHYNSLEDVAALCAALDIVVSIKISVPIISAGVGTVTKLANWRQSDWNNILMNPVGPSVDIFEKNTLEPWHEVFSVIAEDIMKFSIKANRMSGNSKSG